MTWRTHPNQDGSTVGQADIAPGPSLGFVEGYKASLEQQQRNQSLDGLAWYFSAEDEKNMNNAREKGVAYTPLYKIPGTEGIDPATGMPSGEAASGGITGNKYSFRNYYQIAKAITDKEENFMSEPMRKQNELIAKLNTDNPGLGLKTMDEMFATTRQRAQEVERRANLPHSWGGTFGGFAGGAVGGLDPRTDVTNFATLPIGFGAATVLKRIGMQALGQGGIELVNQLSGVQESRRMLGLDHGFGQAAMSVGGAAVGGAAIQGVGEAAAVGLRRLGTGKWFADTPADPAPPVPAPAPAQALPPPGSRTFTPAPEDMTALRLAMTRTGRPRAEGDLEHVVIALNDWSGPKPWEIPPPTSTRIPGVVNMEAKLPDLSAHPALESVDVIARRVDPEIFVTYDKLAARMNDLRAKIDDTETLLSAAREAQAGNEAAAQIAVLKSQLTSAKGKARGVLEQRIADLEQTATPRADPTVIKSAQDEAASSQAALREELQRVDQSMRDVAPAVSRAYARAQGKWESYGREKAAIDDMIANGREAVTPWHKDIGDAPADIVWTPTLKDQVPGLAGVELKPGETLATAAQRVNVETTKAVDEAIQKFQSSIKSILDPPKDADPKITEPNVLTLNINGKQKSIHLDSDKITIPGEDGGMRVVSARQMLKELEDDNFVLKAITSCSLPATS